MRDDMMHFKEWLSGKSDVTEGVINDQLMQMLMREVGEYVKSIAKNSGRAFETTFENIAGRLPIGSAEEKMKIMGFINTNRPRSTDDDKTIQEKSTRIANFLIDEIEKRLKPDRESATAVKKEIGAVSTAASPTKSSGMPSSAGVIRKLRTSNT